MIEYDDPHRAAYRGHFAGIEGSNLARSPAPEERQTAPIPGGALTRDLSLYVRAYWPKVAVIDGSWTPPAVKRVGR